MSADVRAEAPTPLTCRAKPQVSRQNASGDLSYKKRSHFEQTMSWLWTEFQPSILAGLGGCGNDALNPHIGDHVAVVMLVVAEIQDQQTHAVDAPFISIFLSNFDDFLA